MSTWRMGKQVPINVYEDDRPVCQCHTATDAQRMVAAMNRVEEHIVHHAEGCDCLHCELKRRGATTEPS